MGHHESAYYPPRARWYRGLFSPWYVVRKWLRLERLAPVGGFKSFNRLILGLALPGYAFAGGGLRRWSRAVGCAYGLSSAVFVVWLGYDVSNWAFGLMVGLHATSAVVAWNRWSPPDDVRQRLVRALVALLSIGLLVYWPLRTVGVDYGAMPVRLQNRAVVVVNPRARAPAVRRGDWVVYRISGTVNSGHRDIKMDGLELEQVVAMAGERVRFFEDHYQLNDRSFPLRAHMPKSGEWGVPEKHWLIWPNMLASVGQAQGVEQAIAEVMQRNAIVSFAELAGKPYGYWFWRRQVWE